MIDDVDGVFVHKSYQSGVQRAYVSRSRKKFRNGSRVVKKCTEDNQDLRQRTLLIQDLVVLASHGNRELRIVVTETWSRKHSRP
jgi:hypothetical protein